MIAAAAEYEYSKSLTGLRLDKIGKGVLPGRLHAGLELDSAERSAKSS